MVAAPTTTARKEDEVREFEFGRDAFDFLARLAYERTGIVLGEAKYDMVYSRLVRRLRALQLPDFESYCDLLRSDQADSEIGAMVNAITTNLTHFFREPHHFESLLQHCTDCIKTQTRLRVWSAGCSSGMEPYSIAMTLLETLPDSARRDLKILATDIDSGMLEKARAGTYMAEEFENIPPRFRTHATCDEQGLHIGAAPRALIAFKELNLLGDWPMKGPFDVIFCRNVIIYFDVPTKQKLLERYVSMLHPGGLLFIGHSESVPATVKGLRLIGRTTYQREA